MTSRFKVLMVSPEWPSASGEHLGGVGRYAFRLAESLSAFVDLDVATLDNPMPLDGVRFIELGAPRTRLQRYYGLPWRARRALQCRQYDIVHSHGDDWALRLRGTPLVRTFHGSSWREAVSSRGARRMNHVVLAALEHFSARRARVRIAVGLDSQEEFHCDMVMPPIQRVSRAGLSKHERPSFVFIGSFHGRKRGAVVLEAVEHARQFEPNLSLDVVGPPGDASNWPSWVRHHSGIADAQVYELIERSWALLAPSSYEGFGIPVFEAAALGTVAVASPNPGSKFIAGRFGASLVIRLRDDSGFVEEVLSIAQAVAAPSSVDPEGDRRAVEGMLADASARTLIEKVYARLLGGRRP
ncbi:glycosyltransferase family 4 protein [Demequina mangrovi]|uniref:Glycosyltransferase involved in cell wall bisynthesis n=1 Tax=Demequina mangrovi TaxID=1043493 RepID=A0A1H6YIL9_9MICO|nr:glycosyltransferase family 4 protein [Demequina mangrovi]SEJ40266.1 Glycosyltransferase involved in cell wall bisynthesis [Demequina mangrovi]